MKNFPKIAIFERNSATMLLYEKIKTEAENVGFNLCGIAKCRFFEEELSFFGDWLAQGKASSLDYLGRNIDKRFDATLLYEGAKSVVVCALPYKNFVSDGYPETCRTKVASYAVMRDYHAIIKEKLRLLLLSLQRENGSLRGRVFTDSAPMLEKRYAVEAGLGWIGRQSLLVTPQYGSFVLLGELVLCDECDRYDEPYIGVGCGNCRRCIDACPTGAVEERHIDTRRCISCATIEKENDFRQLHGWIFGCDLCQSCCPYNINAPYASCKDMEPLFDPRSMRAEDWLNMRDEEFSSKLGNTPLSRSGLARIKQCIKGKEVFDDNNATRATLISDNGKGRK